MAKQNLNTLIGEGTLGVAKIDTMFDGLKIVPAVLLQTTKDNPYIADVFEEDNDRYFDKTTGRQIVVISFEDAEMLVNAYKQTGAVDVKGIKKNEFRALSY